MGNSIGHLALVYCPHRIILLYDVDASSLYALPHSVVTWLPSQRWQSRRSHMAMTPHDGQIWMKLM